MLASYELVLAQNLRATELVRQHVPVDPQPTLEDHFVRLATSELLNLLPPAIRDCDGPTTDTLARPLSAVKPP